MSRRRAEEPRMSKLPDRENGERRVGEAGSWSRNLLARLQRAPVVDDSLPTAPCPPRTGAVQPLRQTGTVTEAVGLSIRVRDLAVPVGSICRIAGRELGSPVLAEVIGFAVGQTILMPLSPVGGVRQGDRVQVVSRHQSVPVGEGLLGRVMNGSCEPIDGRGPLGAEARYPLDGSPPDPVHRQRITEPVTTGVRAIDALMTCGKGQRMGIFSGTGVGKSVLLGMIARYTSADVSVVALVGERGREVRDFLERELGPQGLARSVVVVSTSYEPPPLRVKAGHVAAAIAEYFRDQGRDVMFLMDSVTRIATAQREVGLSAGEPPATRGYPPSVFALLPRLLERAGCSSQGTITGFYNVLVEGDDLEEPISDAARGVLDGHLWLDRRLAARQHYPAISVLESVSQLSEEVTDAEHSAAAGRVKALLAAYTSAEDLISIGAYVKGTDPEVDLAIEMRPRIEAFLRQRPAERASFEAAREGVISLAVQAAQAAAANRRPGNPTGRLSRPALPPTATDAGESRAAQAGGGASDVNATRGGGPTTSAASACGSETVRPKPFTLQRLLEIRRLRQKQQQAAAAAAGREVRHQEAEVERVIGRQVAARDTLRDLLIPGPVAGRPAAQMRSISITDVKRCRAYFMVLGQEAGRAAARLPALRQSEAAQRAQLVEARRATKVLENLRRRRQEACRRWARRREQKVLDDLANGQRAVRSAQ